MKQFFISSILLLIFTSDSHAQFIYRSPVADYSIQAESLRYRHRSSLKNGAIAGAITGLVAGAIVGYFSNPPGCAYQPGVCVSHDRWRYAANKAGIGAALGAGLGLTLGIVVEYGGAASAGGPVDDRGLYYSPATFAPASGPQGSGVGVKVRW